MKNGLFVLFLLVLTLSASTQNYKLFNAGSKKVFTTFPDAGLTYSLAFDSAVQSGVDSVYYPYRNIEDEFIDADSCMFWGGPTCRPQTKPGWIGTGIVKKPADTYQFTTNAGLSLIFNFGLLPGEDSQFFEDDVQRFKISAENPDTMNVCGQVDSVKFFRITHRDIQGNIIESALNNQLIMLGKDFGLIRFFPVDSFPLVLQPMTLIGNSSPETGLVILTHEMIYDHQPGDEIQYREWYNNSGGPPAANYQRFTKHVFLERNNSPDTITYRIERSVFEMGSDVMITDTILLKYRRDEVLAEIPYDYIDQNNRLEYRVLELKDYCGFSMWTYIAKPEHLIYCVEDNCWGVYDTQGPPPIGETRLVAGLGLYVDVSAVISPPPYGYSSGEEIVFFKKNGNSCGQEVIVNVGNQPLIDYSLTIYPNPAGNKLFIKTETAMNGTIRILNLSGQLIAEMSFENSLSEISTENLKPGIYLVKVIGNKGVAIKKFIKQ